METYHLHLVTHAGVIYLAAKLLSLVVIDICLEQQFGFADGAGDDLYQELWRLCAGPLMDLPEPTEQELRQMMDQKSPKYDLPSKILCQVIDVKCLAETESDEVYARITLQPSSDNESLDPNPICSEKPTQKVYSFIKDSEHLGY
ncbi:hypothetical protein PIB30_043221 [Stylosanthes scabra]|uniref:Uncharacterized protein n=1 Tax=Stylosanthes scabra TaxID=79078 RepID=A0ABU6QEX2_9FABA|nr:hypothetical protein [Stylosanthes scabra]